jgi:CBS domain-containing protein
MEIESPMTKLVVCLTPTNTISDAYGVMKETICRHLPIVMDGKVVGIISNRDILLHSKVENNQLKIEKKLVGEVMTKNPITAMRHSQVSRVVDLLVNNRISCLPIVDKEDRIEGIITTTDLLLLLKREFSEKIPFHFNVQSFDEFRTAV